jgi:hypothetical protein
MRNKHPRHYALYERDRLSGRRWIRITTTAYPLKYAVVIYQDRMLNSVLNPSTKEMRLRPVD